MYEKLWCLFVAILGGIVTLKKSTTQYIFYKVDQGISTYGVHVIFQFFSIYFNRMIQDII